MRNPDGNGKTVRPVCLEEMVVKDLVHWTLGAEHPWASKQWKGVMSIWERAWSQAEQNWNPGLAKRACVASIPFHSPSFFQSTPSCIPPTRHHPFHHQFLSLLDYLHLHLDLHKYHPVQTSPSPYCPPFRAKFLKRLVHICCLLFCNSCFSIPSCGPPGLGPCRTPTHWTTLDVVTTTSAAIGCV